jgi:predicted DsbA family dithiol-disulfide isomerase
MRIDLVLDVVCPWCLVGKRNLDAALSQLSHDIAVDVVFRPYQLAPDLPPQGVDRNAYLLAKVGDPNKLAAMRTGLEQAAQEAGISLNLGAQTRYPNSLNAHRLIRWAQGQGLGAAMVEALLDAYFVQGQDLSDQAVLVSLATAVGLDADVIRRLLASDADCAAIRAEIDQARRLGISAVPCFIFNGREAVMGAQPPSVLLTALKRAGNAPANS